MAQTYNHSMSKTAIISLAVGLSLFSACQPDNEPADTPDNTQTSSPAASWSSSMTESATLTIPEANVVVSFPNIYTLEKSTEENRRGSFVSYEFEKSGEYIWPHFVELQFFSNDSISDFSENCGDSPCFFGDYPDEERYTAQKKAFAEGKSVGDFKLLPFGDRNWFASSHPCIGDYCVIREYTTFIGDTKIDAWIMMGSPEETRQADVLFTRFSIR